VTYAKLLKITSKQKWPPETCFSTRGHCLNALMMGIWISMYHTVGRAGKHAVPHSFRILLPQSTDSKRTEESVPVCYRGP
jgi:hypothetical protein